MDTLRDLIETSVTPASERQRHGARRCSQVTGKTAEAAWTDGDCMGEKAWDDARAAGIELRTGTLSEAERDSELLPKRRLVQRSMGWLA